MFAGHTHCLPYIRNYAEAHAHWEKTKYPARSKKWRADQRPLKNTRSWHYRLEKGNGYYDVCLYTTVMARFFEPSTIGARHCYFGDNSMTSQKFMSDVLGVQTFKECDTTDGRRVIIPITAKRMPDSDFSADLVFVDGNLDVGMSQHTPIFKVVSNEHDKAMRKKVKQAIEPLLTLCALRIPELERTVSANFNVAGSFQSARVFYDSYEILRDMVTDILAGLPIQDEHVEGFIKTADRVYEKAISDKAYAAGLLSWHKSLLSATELPCEQRVTEKAFVAAVWRMVQKAGRLSTQSATMPYPQFPTREQITLSNVVTWQA